MLFDRVCEHLNLLEKDYFGITYRDVENQKVKAKVHLHTTVYSIKLIVLNMLIIVTVVMWAPLETLVLVVYSQSGSHRDSYFLSVTELVRPQQGSEEADQE